MKYRNACLLLLALICALSLLGCSAANEEPDADPVVARYRDTEPTKRKTCQPSPAGRRSATETRSISCS